MGWFSTEAPRGHYYVATNPEYFQGNFSSTQFRSMRLRNFVLFAASLKLVQSTITTSKDETMSPMEEEDAWELIEPSDAGVSVNVPIMSQESSVDTPIAIPAPSPQTTDSVSDDSSSGDSPLQNVSFPSSPSPRTSSPMTLTTASFRINHGKEESGSDSQPMQSQTTKYQAFEIASETYPSATWTSRLYDCIRCCKSCRRRPSSRHQADEYSQNDSQVGKYSYERHRCQSLDSDSQVTFRFAPLEGTEMALNLDSSEA